MEITDQQRRLLELCAIRIDQESVDWSLLARQAQYPGGLDDLCQGLVAEKSAVAKKSVVVLRRGLRDLSALTGRVVAEIEAAAKAEARLVTVLDRAYPANLRLIPNLPPFLFYRGELRDDDARSVAVDAGARTIAVMGTGITQCYPSENRDLAGAIASSGALVSQFWPTRSPGRDTFPRRNVVTSGISQGTVVIEAASTSGAKMQARLALEHGKKVFLVQSLVITQPWAKDYVDRRGAIEVADVEEVLAHLAEPERVRQATEQHQQLSLSYL